MTRKVTARAPSTGALGRKTAAENEGTSANSCRVYTSEKAIRIAMLTQSAAMRPADAAVPQSLPSRTANTDPTMLGQNLRIAMDRPMGQLVDRHAKASM